MNDEISPLTSVEQIEEGERYHYLFLGRDRKEFTVEKIWEGMWGPKWETIYTLRFEDGEKLTPYDTLSEQVSNGLVYGH